MFEKRKIINQEFVDVRNNNKSYRSSKYTGICIWLPRMTLLVSPILSLRHNAKVKSAKV